MKNLEIIRKKKNQSINPSIPDKDADKSGTDKDSDSTEKRNEPGKFDKPSREADPDKTGIDTDSDKTKKENK